MAPKIFLTGVTGYIGGDVFYALHSKHSDWKYALLVRSEEKGQQVKKAYPDVRIVIGDLDSAKLLEDEAAEADIVIHTANASDHEVAARAIAAGLARHRKGSPGFWLHTGGTGILCWEDMRHDRLGEYSDKEYNDWSGVDDLVNLPADAFHRNVDEIVLEAGTKHSENVKTVIICPPTIYGRGRGPVSPRSRQAYELAHLILTKKFIPIIGKGKARWNNIHVADLADLFTLLAEAAVAGNLSDDLWGVKGYFLAENGEMDWADFAREMGRKAEQLGYVGKLEEAPLSKDEAMEAADFQAVSWGLNSRGKAERGAKTLGWEPHRPSLEDTVEEILQDEHGRL